MIEKGIGEDREEGGRKGYTDNYKQRIDTGRQI